MDATAQATLWVFLGFVVFLGILLYLKIPAKLAEALDARSAKIKSDLDDARRLREEAQALLAEYQRRRTAAEREAEEIVTQARREAVALGEEARARLEDYVARRTRAVEQRIAQAETQAVAEVRNRAIDVAAAAASRLVAEQAKGATGEQLLQRSIQAVRSNLN
jgi:F-type H+-transporting ATPase subunit b